MKYIRALDDIWEYNQKDNIAIRPSKCFEKCEQMLLQIKKDYIEKQADTIEELCDEFIGIVGNMHRQLTGTNIRSWNDHTVYGAIWTDKGLIYVAKMNDKGELELL